MQIFRYASVGFEIMFRGIDSESIIVIDAWNLFCLLHRMERFEFQYRKRKVRVCECINNVLLNSARHILFRTGNREFHLVIAFETRLGFWNFQIRLCAWDHIMQLSHTYPICPIYFNLRISGAARVQSTSNPSPTNLSSILEIDRIRTPIENLTHRSVTEGVLRARRISQHFK